MGRAGRRAWFRAHPRVCGENQSERRIANPATGSSPRVRGKHTTVVPPALDERLIPACAGKTESSTRALPRSGAHPRVCGENPSNASPRSFECGSSPRVRGKLALTALDAPPRRLIPACAGKTASSRVRRKALPAHPRVCGENIGAIVQQGGVEGSSPRVRGKR